MLHPRDKGAAIIAAALIYNRKVNRLISTGAPPSTQGELARDSAAEVAMLILAIEKHLPSKRRNG